MKRILAALVGVLLCAATLLACTSCGTPDLSYEEQKTAYDGIIAEYTSLLTARQNGDELTPPKTDGMKEEEATIAEALYGIVADQKAEILADLGYSAEEIDGMIAAGEATDVIRIG